MMASAADYTLAYCVEQLTLTRAALTQWRTNAGVSEYSIEGRNARIAIDRLERDERKWIQEIHRIEGVQRPLRTIVPVDVR